MHARLRAHLYAVLHVLHALTQKQHELEDSSFSFIRSAFFSIRPPLSAFCLFDRSE